MQSTSAYRKGKALLDIGHQRVLELAFGDRARVQSNAFAMAAQ